jgi:SOS-response transcriptional repressor LexA
MQGKTIAKWLQEAMTHADKMSGAELARRMEKRLRRNYDRTMVNKMLLERRDISAEEMLVIEEITKYPAPAEANSKQTLVPLIDFATAGRLANPATQIPVEGVPLIAFADIGSGDFFALRVEDDSMDRHSPAGATVVVDRGDRELVAGRAYVFWHRSAGTTYKLWKPAPPRLEPYSWNPANEPIFIKGKRDFSVVGRVRRSVLEL